MAVSSLTLTASRVEVDRLSYTYADGHPALAEVSLSLAAGERLAILGGNGAGKSTLLLCLTAVIRYRGSLLVDGIEALRQPKEVRRRVGFVFQNPGEMLFSPNCQEEVAYGPLCQNRAEEEVTTEVERWLRWARLDKKTDQPPFSLSYGEQRRLALAAVLACKPSLLALDEPTAMLDPAARREVITLLLDLPQTLIVSTHDLDFARRVAPRAVVLHHGKLVYDGSTAKLLDSPNLHQWHLG
ncbi:energy-coupling factor ABC transporter ATP-binding protein [bacterium]|nr:energy-coupling factor ABC transporter ATP-binding protein [bacterium]